MSEVEKEKKVYKYSKEKIQEYNLTYQKKHENEKIYCDQCKTYYKYTTKSYHPRSKHHLIALQILESLSTPKDNHEMASNEEEEVDTLASD